MILSTVCAFTCGHSHPYSTLFRHVLLHLNLHIGNIEHPESRFPPLPDRTDVRERYIAQQYSDGLHQMESSQRNLRPHLRDRCNLLNRPCGCLVRI